mgnify:CR=1 FL=1
MSLVQMTLSGGTFILFIVVVRALVLHRLPKGAFLTLWEMAALMAAWFAAAYVRALRRFRWSTPDDAPAVRRWLAGQKLRRPLEVRQSAQVFSPLTYGVLRPVILLPADMERGDENALAYILTHELVHWSCP